MGGEERSSRRYWVDKCSTNNCFLNFCIVPVEFRRGFNVVVPSAWSERDKVIWCYGERYLERELFVDEEIELFMLSRNYEELIERLEVEKINNMKYLPCKIEMDDYFDDTVVNDKHLPNDVIDIVEEYKDKITYLMLTKNTDGDWNKITNVDGFYELTVDKNVVNYCVNVINENNLYNNNNNSVMSVSKDDNYYINVMGE